MFIIRAIAYWQAFTCSRGRCEKTHKCHCAPAQHASSGPVPGCDKRPACPYTAATSLTRIQTQAINQSPAGHLSHALTLSNRYQLSLVHNTPPPPSSMTQMLAASKSGAHLQVATTNTWQQDRRHPISGDGSGCAPRTSRTATRNNNTPVAPTKGLLSDQPPVFRASLSIILPRTNRLTFGCAPP